MANFNDAYDNLMGFEAESAVQSYSNLPSDRGGETFMGISRLHHPSWDGWAWLDSLKTKHLADFPKILTTDKEAYRTIRDMVKAFYRQQFWDVIWGDHIPEQDIANELYEQAVNKNHVAAVKNLQRVLNVLNGRGKYFPDQPVDGKIGTKTIDAINAYLGRLAIMKQRGFSVKPLLGYMNALQGAQYLELAEKDQSQEDFIWGWAKRI